MDRTIEQVVAEVGVSPRRLAEVVGRWETQRARYRRLWAYYANPMRLAGAVTDPSERPYRLAQEWGMPERITGYRAGADPLSDGAISGVERKEVVVQNDIAWRVDTMVDYLFGRMPQVISLAPEAKRREAIEAVLAGVLEGAGGTGFLQSLALVGCVYGFADVAVTLGEEAVIKRVPGAAAEANTGATSDHVLDMARLVSLQVVEPTRAFALLDEMDVSRTLAYVQMYEARRDEQREGWRGLLERLSPGGGRSRVTEIWTSRGWWRWLDEQLVGFGGNSLGRVPVVHLQNAAGPFAYDGASEVEVLMPLQDELNTRLSDRAYRLAQQSFRMYLAKNVESFGPDAPPAPGRYWTTTNPDAEIVELGGVAHSPSEDVHIAEIREAMDRVSGVPPVAAGAIRNRIGNLTSAAALRVTLMSLLSRTERKRALYGGAIEGMCQMALEWLDAAGAFATTLGERRVELQWPSALPENDVEKLEEAKMKVELGVGKEVVLKELGY